MRPSWLVTAALFVVVGCSKRNPNACCLTAAECADVGFDEITPCLGVEVCIDGTCEEPNCTTSVDCTDPSQPFCVANTCVAACEGNDSCIDPALPFCASDGQCVECLDDTACGASAPICAPESQSCRACIADAECASGICLGYEGVCLATPDAVFVSGDGEDRGDCTAAAPCATIPFALPKLTTTRRVLRIEDVDYVAPSPIVINRDVYFDAAGTRLTATGSTDVLTFGNSAKATLEGVRLVQATILVSDEAEVVAYDIELEDATITVAEGEKFGAGGDLTVLRSRLTEDSRVTCGNISVLKVLESELVDSVVYSSFCDTTVARTRFLNIQDTEAIRCESYLSALVENNVIQMRTGTQGGFITLQHANGSQDSVVRFNTMVRIDDGVNLVQHLSPEGAGGLLFSSNIIVGVSESSLSLPNTVADHNLTDSAFGPIDGDGNITAGRSTIFMDLTGGDYALSASSPARGGGASIHAVDVDIDGHPRPRPAGTEPDIGAYEAE
jgi:hypothetical protein